MPATRPSAGLSLQQLLGGAPATLGGQGETAIFAEAALVQQVEHVLPRGTLSGLAPPGQRLRTTLVAQRCLALEYLGEIGADMRQVQRLFGRYLLVVILRRFEEQQRRALLQRLPEARREPPDDTAAGCLDLEFHLHRFQDRDPLAGTHPFALGHFQGHQHPAARRRQRQAAEWRLDPRRRGVLGERALGAEPRMARRDRRQQCLQVAFDEAGVDPVGLYRRMQQKVAQQIQVARHALQAEFAERPVGPAQRGGIIRTTHDQLGQQRIVAGADPIAGIAVAVHPQAGTAGRFVGADSAHRRTGAAVGRQGLQVDPQLHRAAADRRRSLQAEGGKLHAGGETQLGVQQVDPGDFLGDGVLHLDARIGFHEIEAPGALVVDQELEGTDPPIAHRAGHAQGAIDQRLAGGLRQVRAGRDLQQLLLAPLQAAIALPEVADRTAAVAEHLHLDVPRPRYPLLDV